jgi:hypothetical protein
MEARSRVADESVDKSPRESWEAEDLLVLGSRAPSTPRYSFRGGSVKSFDLLRIVSAAGKRLTWPFLARALRLLATFSSQE